MKIKSSNPTCITYLVKKIRSDINGLKKKHVSSVNTVLKKEKYDEDSKSWYLPGIIIGSQGLKLEIVQVAEDFFELRLQISQ